MSPKIYNWKRFWCAREGKLNLSDDGYLLDPDAQYGSIHNPDVVPFESISKFPCLALLGEPGMGKSTGMQTQKGSIDALVSKSGDASLWVDLRAYQTDVRLAQGIFEAPVFQDWLNGKHRLHLFLDSLDECLLRVDTVAALLIEEFGKHPMDRLYLRIACRTADWPGALEDGLRSRPIALKNCCQSYSETIQTSRRLNSYWPSALKAIPSLPKKVSGLW